MTVPERLAKIETTLDRLDHTLNGNGQPGLADKLEKFITEQYRLCDRVRLMEHTKTNQKTDLQWLVTAGIAIAAVVVAIFK